MNSDLFGGRLEKDPAIALPPLSQTSTVTSGPIYKTQFVVELVGPRTAAASAVRAILEPHWQNTLGNPEAFVMAAADKQWRALEATDTSGAFDSIALTWDLLGPSGTLSSATAQHLWNVSEDLAKQLKRRALALPVPDDVNGLVGYLQEMREELDIGVNFSVLSNDGLPEKEIWKVAAGLGLDYISGAFQWRSPGSELPVFEITPIGDCSGFSLSQVQLGVVHIGLAVGFSVPLSQAPMVAFDGCIKAGQAFAQRLRGVLLDEADQPVTSSSAATLRSNLEHAVVVLRKQGFAPGSIAALSLFGT